MLVLSRKPGEKILIGTSIELTVVEVRGQQVRLGLSAPPEVPVDRAEVRQLHGQRVPAEQDGTSQRDGS